MNLQNILRDSAVEFHENRTHIILKNCPNCDGRDKLFIQKSNHLWQCFKCKGEGNDETRSGNLRKLLNKVLGFDHVQITTLLRDGEAIQYVPESLPEKQVEEAVEVVEEKNPLPTADEIEYFKKYTTSVDTFAKVKGTEG
jgi:ribosomal protein L37AE/L43A